MYAKMIFPQYKVKMSHILQNMYVLMKYWSLESLK